MNYGERLESELRSVVEAFDAEPALKRLHAGDISLDHFRSFLQQNYYLLSERHALVALAATRLRAGPDITKYFLNRAVQEIRHELLALKDLEALGGDPSAVRQQHPLPETMGVIAYTYYQITQLDPVGFLGCMAFHDYTPIAAQERYHEALKRIGLPDEAANLFKDVKMLGPTYTGLIETYVEELVRSEADVEAVTLGMRNYAALFANMVRAAFDDVDRGS